MRELKKKQYWGSLSLLLLVIIIAVGYFMVYPSVGQLKEANINVAAKEKDVNDLQNKISSLNKLDTEMKNNPDKMKMLELGIPATDAQAEIIATLSGIASNSGTTIKSISQSQSKESDFSQILLVFETSYNGFQLMLNSLENNIRFAGVNTISLTRNIKTEGAEGYLSGSMIIEMFKYTGTETPAESPATTNGGNQ